MVGSDVWFDLLFDPALSVNAMTYFMYFIRLFSVYTYIPFLFWERYKSKDFYALTATIHYSKRANSTKFNNSVSKNSIRRIIGIISIMNCTYSQPTKPQTQNPLILHGMELLIMSHGFGSVAFFQMCAIYESYLHMNFGALSS